MIGFQGAYYNFFFTKYIGLPIDLRFLKCKVIVREGYQFFYNKV